MTRTTARSVKRPCSSCGKITSAGARPFGTPLYSTNAPWGRVITWVLTTLGPLVAQPPPRAISVKNITASQTLISKVLRRNRCACASGRIPNGTPIEPSARETRQKDSSNPFAIFSFAARNITDHEKCRRRLESRMKGLVIRSGGREHALVWKLAQSPRIDAMWCAPGNAGISGENLRNGKLVECLPNAVEDFAALSSFAKDQGIGLTVVGPDNPLAAGIVDH